MATTPANTPIVLFVYGTLRAGWSNHRLLADQKPLGAARTESGYAMFADGIPFVVRDASAGAVVGELYEVTQEALIRLDRLEGHPSMYRREVIQLDDGREVQSYIWQRRLPPRAERVDDGDFASVKRP